jgi:hypothetical protein
MKLLRQNQVVATHLYLLTPSFPVREGRLGMFCLSPDHTQQEEKVIEQGSFTLMLDNGQEVPIQINLVSRGQAITAYFQTRLKRT